MGDFHPGRDLIRSRAELAREAVLSEASETRANVLRPLSLDSSEIENINALDYTRYLSFVHQLHTIIGSQHVGLPETLPNLSTLLGSLKNEFPAAQSGRSSKSSNARRQADLNRLALDLALSTTVLSSEDFVGAAAVQTPANADDFLSRAANLTLNDAEPPPITFTVIPPRSVPGKDEDSDSIEPDPQSALQSLPARSVFNEWTLGSDPSEYTWKEWRNPAVDVENGISSRPIRPLPSPRSSHPPTFASEQAYPRPPGLSYSQPQPPSISAIPRPISSRTMETFGGTAAIARGLPLRVFGSSGIIGDLRSSSPVLGADMDGPMTQVERGPFGGRMDGKKKKVKKRAGGF